MSQSDQIPLGNLYRMLCYAWGRTDRALLQLGDAETFDRIEDLFGVLLAGAAKDIVRRGLARGYIERADDLRAPRGKIQPSDTMKRQLRPRGRVSCNFDEWSVDVPANRIVRAGLNLLIPLASHGVRHELIVVERAFRDAAHHPLSSNLFRSLVVSAGQRHYGFALDLCALLARWSLPTADGSRRRAFVDPRRSEREMGWLFEAFVRRYLDEHLVDHRVLAERKLDWALQTDSPAAASVVPAMFTDIRLVGPLGQCVVETKFTTDALPANQYGKKTLRAAHLYQLHAYVTHLGTATVPVSHAVLLIGAAEPSFAHRYRMDGVDWTAASVDLRAPWAAICSSMISAISGAGSRNATS